MIWVKIETQDDGNAYLLSTSTGAHRAYASLRNAKAFAEGFFGEELTEDKDWTGAPHWYAFKEERMV